MKKHHGKLRSPCSIARIFTSLRNIVGSWTSTLLEIRLAENDVPFRVNNVDDLIELPVGHSQVDIFLPRSYCIASRARKPDTIRFKNKLHFTKQKVTLTLPTTQPATWASFVGWLCLGPISTVFVFRGTGMARLLSKNLVTSLFQFGATQILKISIQGNTHVRRDCVLGSCCLKHFLAYPNRRIRKLLGEKTKRLQIQGFPKPQCIRRKNISNASFSRWLPYLFA